MRVSSFSQYGIIARVLINYGTDEPEPSSLLLLLCRLPGVIMSNDNESEHMNVYKRSYNLL
jgi:hypothetical protein